MLLVLAATKTGSQIKILDTNFLVGSENKVVSSVKLFTKTSKLGRQPQDLIFYCFPENENFCIAKTLEFYLKTNEAWRKKGDHLQLLLSLIKLHKPISSATLARWMIFLKHTHH